MISGQCAIFLSLHDRIDPETRKRDPHPAGIKKLPSAFSGCNSENCVQLSHNVQLTLHEEGFDGNLGRCRFNGARELGDQEALYIYPGNS